MMTWDCSSPYTPKSQQEHYEECKMRLTDHRLLQDSSAAISDSMFAVPDPAVLELSDMRILSARQMPVWAVAFRQRTNMWIFERRCHLLRHWA
jgi:hypothetical protein